ncbi:MAG TPA: phenylalanine--tRNA ligase subunit alpha [Polyangia bacterium]|nr:phenylalanine--tRNA ligase subunit alpha [Polyangia bacterium]
MELEISALISRFQDELAQVHSEQELRRLQALYLGREGALTVGRKNWFAGATPETKRSIGEAFNRAKTTIEEAVEGRLVALANEARLADLRRTVDVTLPGRSQALGHLHPVTLARREIERIFAQLGFALATGPQVETDFNNFEALAMPPDHPARDMQDTFYLAGQKDILLRTHTSPVQIRTMLAVRPPVRVICPGPVYRRDDDPTHSPMFHQVEGLVVDEQVSFADLKGTLLHFARAFFGEGARVRLRPSFFPFTEPSAELDFSCVFCQGSGVLGSGEACRVCKRSGWLEVGGAGMVDPEVFRHVSYDSERYTGFAFGFGIDRMAMLKYGISDIKLLFSGDQRLLSQLG